MVRLGETCSAECFPIPLPECKDLYFLRGEAKMEGRGEMGKEMGEGTIRGTRGN